MYLRLLFIVVSLIAVTGVEAKRLVRRLPHESYTLAGYYDVDSVREVMSRKPLHRIEGIWSFPSDGASVAIVGDSDRSDAQVLYRMVILRSPCRSLRPGTVMGHIAATARPGVYAAEIYTSGSGGATLYSPRSFTLTLIDDAHLTFRQHSRKIKVNLWRLIPYMSRIGLRIGESDAPADIDGCTRVYPRPLSGPVEPRYL